MMKKNHYPSLDELAFEGRNKEYGGYYLRKKYNRYLLVSLIISVFVFLILVIIPIAYDYFRKPDYSGELYPYIEFYSLNPPSDDDLNALAKAMATPPPEEQPPVVVDTIKPDENKAVVKPNPEEEKKEATNDSVTGRGKGNSGNSAGPGEETGIYTTIDVYPRFPGGDQGRFYFLRTNIRYPDAALKANVQGIVLVVFVVEPNGSISHVEISKGIGGGCDEEALRVTKSMPRWEPGKRSGRAVRVLVRMPIVFKIPGK